MPKQPRAIVLQEADKPVERNVLAQAVVRISKAADDLRRSSGLNDRALILLIADSSRVNRSDVAAVLHSLESLTKDYCR